MSSHELKDRRDFFQVKHKQFSLQDVQKNSGPQWECMLKRTVLFQSIVALIRHALWCGPTTVSGHSSQAQTGTSDECHGITPKGGKSGSKNILFGPNPPPKSSLTAPLEVGICHLDSRFQLLMGQTIRTFLSAPSWSGTFWAIVRMALACSSDQDQCHKKSKCKRKDFACSVQENGNTKGHSKTGGGGLLKLRSDI